MIAINPRAAAVAGMLLTLPLSCLVSIAAYEIEPMNGYLRDADGQRQNLFSLILLCASFLLLPLAIAINLAPVMRRRANAANIVVACAIGLVIAAMAGGFIADQLPCWRGVPNCD